LAVSNRTGGPDLSWHGYGGARLPATYFRIGARRGSSEFTESGVPGAKMMGVHAREVQRLRVFDLGHWLGSTGLWVMGATAVGASRGGAHRHAMFWAREKSTGYDN